MEENGGTDRFDLRRALAIARRRWRLIAGCALAAAVAAFAFSATQQKQYTASASLLLRDQGLSNALLPTAVSTLTVDPTREAETNINLVSSPAVAARVAKALHMTPVMVANEIAVSAEGATNLVTVQATSPDPRFAAVLANTFATQAIAFRRETDRAQVLQAQNVVQAELNAMTPAERNSSNGQLLQSRDEELNVLAASETGNTQFIHGASVPSAPSLPKTKRNVALGLILGLLLGLGAAALAERLNRRVREPEELREIFGLPVLTEIPEIRAPKSKRGETKLGPNERDAFRMLLARLRYANPKSDSPIQSILVTSPGAREGKSMVAWHLAETAALTGNGRVLLVEADMRMPVIAARHGLCAAPGLCESLAQGLELDEAIQTVPLTGGDEPVTRRAQPRMIGLTVAREGIGAANRNNSDTVHQQVAVELPPGSVAGGCTMDVIVAGTPALDPTTLLESEMMIQLLETLRDQYDLIVFDTVPALLVPDAMPLMNIVERVLVVGRVGVTTRDQASMLKDELDSLNVPTLGLIVNEVEAGSGRAYGHYPKATPEDGTVPRSRPSAPGSPPAGADVRYRPRFKHRQRLRSDGSGTPRTPGVMISDEESPPGYRAANADRHEHDGFVGWKW